MVFSGVSGQKGAGYRYGRNIELATSRPGCKVEVLIAEADGVCGWSDLVRHFSFILLHLLFKPTAVCIMS